MRKSRGQVIILTSLVIVLLILALAVTLNSSSIIYQGVRYEGPKEIVDSISADASRLYTNLLSISTQNYKVNNTIPLAKIYNYFTIWEQTVLAAFSSKDVLINVTTKRNPVTLNWDTNPSNATIGGKLALDIPRLNLFGWNKTYYILLNMKLNTMNQSINELNVTVTQENGIPVDGLRASSFVIQDQTGVDQVIDTIYNIGGGNYLIDLKNPIPSGFIRVMAQDSRGIWVSVKKFSSPVFPITIRNALTDSAGWSLSDGTSGILNPGQTITIQNVVTGTIASVVAPTPIYGFFKESGTMLYTITGPTTLTIATLKLNITNKLDGQAQWSLSLPDGRSDVINSGETLQIQIANGTQVSVTNPTYAFFNKTGLRTITVKTNNTILKIVTFKLTIINRLGNTGTYTVDGNPGTINSLETQTISIANGSQVVITTPIGAFFKEKLASTATIIANGTTLSYAHIEVSISNSLNRQADYLFSDSLIGAGPINVGETKTFSYVRPGWVNVTSPNYGFFGLPVDSRKATVEYSNITLTITALRVTVTNSHDKTATVRLSNATTIYPIPSGGTQTFENVCTGWTLTITDPNNAVFAGTSPQSAVVTITSSNKDFSIIKK